MTARTLTHGGLTLTVSAWAKQPEQLRLGLHTRVLQNRLAKGWSVEDTLTQQRCGRRSEHRAHEVLGPSVIDARESFTADPAARLFVDELGEATLDEVGQALGISRERVRQIETGALKKLRKRMQLAGLGVEDLVTAHRASGRHHDERRAVRSAPANVPPAAVPHEEGRPESSPWRDLDLALEEATRRLEAWWEVLDVARTLDTFHTLDTSRTSEAIG